MQVFYDELQFYLTFVEIADFVKKEFSFHIDDFDFYLEELCP